MYLRSSFFSHDQFTPNLLINLMRKSIASIFLVAVGLSVAAQNKLPVIKANSRSVDIIDGLHFMKAFWYILPEKKPDLYFVEIPRKNHKVTFKTDVDSVSFEVEYGREYDFIILLNNKDSCHTRIVAKEKRLFKYSNKLSGDIDTIPFTIGNNSKVYLKGKLNNSDTLNIQFDFGLSGQSLIKKSSVKKINMDFDGSITLTNSEGTTSVPSSSLNKLNIAGLTWDSLPVAVADNMTKREDMIIGNSLFQHKIIEFNYDKRIIILHDSIPPADTGFTKHDILLDQGIVPFIQAELTHDSRTIKGWFMLDIGAYTSHLSNQHIRATNKMLGEARQMIGLDAKKYIPKLKIGEYSFSDFNYTTQDPSREDMAGILGNDLLKRFNFILDNKDGYLYLKPNSLAGVSYANPEYYVVRVTTLILILFLALIVFFIYRKKIKKNKRAI